MTARRNEVGDLYNFYYTIRAFKPVETPLGNATVGEDFDESGNVFERTFAAGANALRNQVSAGAVAAARQRGPVLTLTNTKGRSVFYSDDPDLAELRNIAASLEITGRHSTAYKLRLTLTPTYEQAEIIIENQLIRTNSLLEVEWGWIDQGGKRVSSDKHLFTTTTPSLDFSGDNISITYVAQDVAGANLRFRRRKKIYSLSEFPTDLDIIKFLISSMKIELDQQALSLLPKDRGLLARRSTKAQQAIVGFLVQATTGVNPGQRLDQVAYEQDASDFDFMRKVLTDNNVHWHLIGNRLVLRDKDRSAERNPDYILSWRTQPKAFNEIPLLNIQINPIRSFFATRHPQTARGYTAIVVNKDQPARDANGTVNTNRAIRRQIDTGEARKAPGSQQASRPLRTSVPSRSAKQVNTNQAFSGETIKVGPGVQVTPTPNLTADETGSFVVQPDRTARAEARLEQMARYASEHANNSATCEIPGVPGLAPQMLVRVNGLPGRFTDNYMVRQVTHTLDSSGYTTRLVLFNKGVSGKKRSTEGATTKAKPNSSKPATTKGTLPQVKDADGNLVG